MSVRAPGPVRFSSCVYYALAPRARARACARASAFPTRTRRPCGKGPPHLPHWPGGAPPQEQQEGVEFLRRGRRRIRFRQEGWRCISGASWWPSWRGQGSRERKGGGLTRSRQPAGDSEARASRPDLNKAEGEVELREPAAGGGDAGRRVLLLGEPLPLLPVHQRARAGRRRGPVLRPGGAAAAAVVRVRVEAGVREEGVAVGGGEVSGRVREEGLGIPVEEAGHVVERAAEEGEEDGGGRDDGAAEVGREGGVLREEVAWR